MAIRNMPRRTGHGTRAVAVDIGSALVRAVEVEMRGDETRMLKRGSAPAPAGVWENLPALRERLGQAIRAAMTAGGITGTQVMAAVPRRLVTLKYVRLPHAAPEQIRGMVQFEAQQYIPFPVDEVVIDHQIVSDENDEMTTVMIVAARRSLVEDVLVAFDSAGLEVQKLSVSTLALAELAQNDMLPTALLDVDAEEMDMAVVAGGKLLFTRSASLIPDLGGEGSTPALVGEVARSLAAYQNEYRAQPVSKLLIAGSPREMNGTAEALSHMLDLPVDRIHGTLFPGGDPDALGYATAMGLAIEANGSSAYGVNLVPSSRAERKEAARRRVNNLAALVALAIVLVASAFFIEKAIDAQNKERRDSIRENNALDILNTRYKTIKSDHDEIAKIYSTVASGLDRKVYAVDVMKAVSDSMPSNGDVFLTQLGFERGANVTIHGNAKSETGAMNLVLALQESGLFSEVRLGYLGDAQADTGQTPVPGAAAAPGKPKTPGMMSFIITCKVSSNPVFAVAPKKKAAAAGPAKGTVKTAEPAKPTAGDNGGDDDLFPDGTEGQ